MSNKIIKPLLLFLSLTVLTSCEIYSIEDVAIIQVEGYDYIDDEQIEGTISIPQFSRVETGATISEKYFSAAGETLKEIHGKLQGKSSRPLIHGKTTVNLYNEELARNDISFLLDNLIRDASIGRDVYLGVVKGSTKELIEKEYSQNERTSRYLAGILDNNIKENFPTTNLHEFAYAYSTTGMDGFSPLLNASGEHVELDGIAFFKKGTYVHSVPFSDSFLFKIMKEDFKYGNRKVEYKGYDYIIENIGSEVKYHVIEGIDNPKFQIEVNLNGILNEVTRFKLPKDPELITKLEKKFASNLEKNCLSMLEEFQEKNIDPLGLGNVMKSRERKFDHKIWKEKYPTAQIDVKVNVEIMETGISS
ncbi:Ger(x)C family spore germination protein [Alkalihalobacillus sp. TS-13]|uniref:Ger(x)C family spore germination protein n=1 Tax=Alkalihalobacillus sp. TS-13 TaxID=2842455 RepID=UPI001C869D42|nr:Ger(x)C family spore germination protein [Alkalihalobacillus sp. TS-13]